MRYSKCDKYCASCDCCRPLRYPASLRCSVAKACRGSNLSLRYNLPLRYNLLDSIGCSLNRACFCAAHRTASCRRIGPRALRWLRRVVSYLPLRRKARVFAVYGRDKCCFHMHRSTQLLRYFSPRGRLNRNA